MKNRDIEKEIKHCMDCYFYEEEVVRDLEGVDRLIRYCCYRYKDSELRQRCKYKVTISE